MSVTNIYTSIACNRTTEAADWGNNGLIVFGACNAVAIYNPRFDGPATKITHTWVQHKKRVNTVQWLRDTPSAHEVYCLSGSDDGLAILWHTENLDQPVAYPLKGHESGVNAVAGLRLANGNWLLATAAADSSLKLWQFDGSECGNFQTLLLNRGFCFTLRLAYVPQSENVLLAFGADDESIALWSLAAGEEGSQFRFVYKLLGHEDWVRGLDFVQQNGELLLASSGQDNFIRMWRIAPRSKEQVTANRVDVLQVMTLDDEIRTEEKIVEVAAEAWVAITVESVLYGHENWVYGVHWHRSAGGEQLRLLSASIDKSLIVWAPTEDGIWMEKVRCGDVGGNSLGFFGGRFAPDGTTIFGHSFTGGFHMWSQSPQIESLWLPHVISGGHFREARDISWEPAGEFLMSVSADQTTRIHAPWRRPGGGAVETWHEIARPQVHGYDMQAVAILSRYRFASGAEEKITRSFQSPANFIENFRRLTGVSQDAEGDALLASLPKGASVPSLGLSNKAVFSVEAPASNAERHVKDEYPENYFVPVSLDAPPQEETLMQNTLWPEVHKLYGHGYEIYALAATADGKLLASSCRSSNAEHAQIILWSTATWKQVQKLPAHQLTVTQMRFSPDGQHLLAVSRDRSWSLHKRQADDAVVPTFALAAHTNKTNGVHTRIIWSCDWSHDSRLFATSSRDGKLAVWTQAAAGQADNDLGGWSLLALLVIKSESFTAVAFGRRLTKDDSYAVAVGMESGLIKVYKLKDANWTEWRSLSNDQAHHLTVNRLQFRPCANEDEERQQLASCGDDNLVRIYEFDA